MRRVSEVRAAVGWRLPALLWPLLLLWPCLFGSRTFLPYDLAQFPPAATALTAAQRAALRADSNFDVTETPVWFVPELTLARQALVEDGELPGWNPNARSGTALLAHGHDSLWHPPTWFALLPHDPADALGWVAATCLCIAGLLAFGLFRALGLSAAASAFGALAFTGSSLLSANAHNLPRLAALIWLPGMLWGLRVAADRTGAQRVPPLCGFALCLQWTWCAGFPPYALPATLVAAGYAAVLLAAEWRLRGAAALRSFALPGLLATAVGVLLMAPYLLPALAFFPDSARPVAPDLRQVSHNVFESYGLLGYLLPDLFGRPDLGEQLPYDRSPLALWLGNRVEYGGQALLPNFNATEYAVFAGSAVLALALAGVGARGTRHRWFPLVALVLLLGLATFTTPLHWLFQLPGMATVPPLRCLGPTSLLLAWLAAHGLERALQPEGRWRAWLAAAVALLVGLVLVSGWWWLRDPEVFEQLGVPQHAAARFAHLRADLTADWVRANFLRSPDGSIDYQQQGQLCASAALSRAIAWPFVAAASLALLAASRGQRQRPLLAVILLLLSAAELWRAGRTFDRGIARTHPVWTDVHEFLVAERARAAEQGGFMVARAAKVTAGQELPPPFALPAGTLQPHGIRDLQVYTFFDRRSIEPLRALLGPGSTQKGYLETCLPDSPLLQHPLFDLLGLRYVFATEPLAFAGERVGPERRGPGGSFFVHQRSGALPRAFVVDRLEAREDDASVLASLTDPGFAPRQVAFATKADLARVPAEALTAAGGASDRSVSFRRDRANHVELSVGPGPAGFLLLTDTFAAGWHARIDGREVPIVRADHFCRAVRLPAAACRVQFDYVVPGLRLGLLLWGAAIVGLAAAWWWTQRAPVGQGQR